MIEEIVEKGLHVDGLEEALAGDREQLPAFMFYKLFGELPNRRDHEGLDKELFYKKVLEEYKLGPKQIIRSEEEEEGVMQLRSFMALIGDECLLQVPPYSYNGEGGMVKVYYSSNTHVETLNKIENMTKQCRHSGYRNNLYLLSNEDFGLMFKAFEIKERQIDLQSHYNDDFLEVDQLIKNRLSKRGEKGIVMLHGEPGTGKTSYIRHLIGAIDKKMIYIPSDMSESLADPKLIQLLSDNKDSIIIIEDAESVLVDRGTVKNSAISNLLNIADGLLSDCLNIQLICTFNVPISRIDNALLRKGRIIASYEMTRLDPDKTNALLQERYGMKTYESLKLSQIYNYDKPDFDRVEKGIGFG